MLNVKKNIQFLIFVFSLTIGQSVWSMNSPSQNPSFQAETPPLPIATSLLRRALQNSPQFTLPPKIQLTSAQNVDQKQQEEEDRRLVEERWWRYRMQQQEKAQKEIPEEIWMQKLATAQKDVQEFLAAVKNDTDIIRPPLPPQPIIQAGENGAMFDCDE